MFREIAGGAKTDRAQLRKALDQRDADDVLMVVRLDRLARSTRDLSTRDLLNTLGTIADRKAGFSSPSRHMGGYHDRPRAADAHCVGSPCFVAVHIMPESPAYRAIPPQHYDVLAGLLNRCARLMLSNVALSCERRFGETTAILDRCIFESAVKIIWLCHSASDEEFTRYLADGLKTEIEFKAKIEANVAANGGAVLSIEARMLRSIANHIDASGLTIKGLCPPRNNVTLRR